MPHLGPALDQPVSLSNLLQAGLERSPDEAALLSRKGEATWSELDAVANGLAANYLALGLKPGDRFASLMPNRIALIAHYLACFKAGLVLTPLNYRYTAPEIDHALDVSGARVMLAHAERAADLAATKAGKLPLGIITFGPKGTSGVSFESLAATGSGGGASEHAAGRSGSHLFHFRQHGAGQGRDPHGRLARLDVRKRGQVVRARPRRRRVAGIVLFAYRRLHALAVGAVGGRAGSRREGLRSRRAWPAVPAGPADGVLDAADGADAPPGRARHDGGRTRLAQAVPIGRRQGPRRTSVRVYRAHRPSNQRRLRHDRDRLRGAASAGSGRQARLDRAASPGFAFSIRDERGEEDPTGGQGRLWVKTPTRTAGYWNDAKASAEIIREEWLDTGDVMKADADGYLWFCGRQKQIIVHDGSNIARRRSRKRCSSIPPWRARASSASIVAHGENVRAYVALKPGVTRPKALDLIEFAKARVGYKAPEEHRVSTRRCPSTPPARSTASR